MNNMDINGILMLMGIECEFTVSIRCGIRNGQSGFVCDVAITNSEASIKSNDWTNESSENFGGSNGQHGYESPTRRIIWIIHMHM